jgi:hypothetical protein
MRSHRIQKFSIGDGRMRKQIGFLLVGLTWLVFPLLSMAQFPARGGLDCNGFSKIQKPLKVTDICADFRLGNARGEDNGHYIGHDEPSIGFFSSAPHSGSNFQWEITLPHERALPATQSFENFATFWFGLALCDPNSGFVRGPCIPNSDRNDPNSAGSAVLEMQFYPPGFPPFINRISCDLTHWCASLHINSLENMDNGELNPNCTETTNFAFIQRNGVPTGPPGFADLNEASVTPNEETLLMNQGDHLRVTIMDVPGDVSGGVMTRIDDLTTGQSGFMVASASNGYQTANPNTCAPSNFSFHPEFATAKFGNFVSWAALQLNVNVAWEIGHFELGKEGDHDDDDAPCFDGPTLPGCLNLATGGDLDFDGTSYITDWPDGTENNAPSAAIRGPLSVSGNGKYSQPYQKVQFETEVGADESTCTDALTGCVIPPPGAAFYPYYSVVGEGANCAFEFGNLSGEGINNFGGDAQYGNPKPEWFFGLSSGGVRANPCIPRSAI